MPASSKSAKTTVFNLLIELARSFQKCSHEWLLSRAGIAHKPRTRMPALCFAQGSAPASMFRHRDAVRHRLRLLPPEIGVNPQEQEEPEIQHGQGAAEGVLDGGDVRVRAEELRNPFGGLAGTDRTQQHEHDRE